MGGVSIPTSAIRKSLLTNARGRATSAAPNYFKPFINSRNNEGFIDGAVFHNNPVKIAHSESQLIWPDIGNRPPDMLLSIGTGHNRSETSGSVEVGIRDRRRERARDDGVASVGPPEPPRSTRGLLFRVPVLTQWLNILFNRMDNLLDGEQLWRSFRSDMRMQHSFAELLPFQRLNLNIGFRPPSLDDKAKYASLHRAVKERLTQAPSMGVKITRVAERLVASSFYFEKMGSLKESGGYYVCQGT